MASSHKTLAISEMGERGALEGQRAAVGSNEARALTALDLADLAAGDVGSPGRRVEASGFGRRHSADDLVIVATRKHGFDRIRVGSDHGPGRFRERHPRNINIR